MFARLLSAASLAALLASCVPSQRTLFGPVDDAVYQRTGIRAEWRSGWKRSPAVEKRVKELLGKPLDAEDAALLAVLNSPALQADYAALSVAGGAVAGARSLENPELEAEILFADGDRHVELAAVQDISQLLTMIPRSREAEHELRASRRRAVARTVELAGEARMAFYGVAAAERVLTLRRSIAEGGAAALELAQRIHEAGNLTNLDLARQEVFHEQAQLDLNDGEAAAQAARERLNALIGLTGEETAWTVDAGALGEVLPLGDLTQLERDAVAANLELDALRWEIQAAGQGIGAARMKSFIPHLGVGVAAQQEEGDWHYGPIVSLSVPLWNWGQGDRAAAWAKLRQVQHRYSALGSEVRAAARASRAQLSAAYARVVRLRERVLPLRERMMAESVLQYNAMNVSVFQLLVERREAIAAEVMYIDALRDYWVAATRVEQLLDGALPSGWAEAQGGNESGAASAAPSAEH
jgi:cobalt-zinc-cadmium efflux system outer membrane protein